jgi:hypothetical protein
LVRKSAGSGDGFDGVVEVVGQGSEAVTVGTGLDLDGAVAAGGADELPD